MDTRIYVMTHKEYIKPEDDMYISMHVGHALGNEFGYLADDTGYNISLKNRNYCELTGMYWIWKNVQCDIVGICHYRRYFVKDEDFIKKEYIEDILKSYDLIVPNSGATQYVNNLEHYEKMHKKTDMLICREVVLEKYPQYIDDFDLCMNTNLASLANMIIARKEVFDAYCEWLFDILFEVERRVDISSYDTFQARIFGYLSERLFRVWLLGNNYRVREEEVKMIKPEDVNNSNKYIELTYRRVELIVNDLIHSYKQGNLIDLVDLKPMDIDFGGKIPVFVCWWQGFEKMPELVKKCIESIDKNVPSDIAEVHFITLENYEMYVKFPLWLVEKFERGIISMTHMSDILRMSLLCLYGGMWIDATFFVSKSMPREIFTEKDFYTLRLSENVWKSDIVQGRWANNWMRMQKGNVLARYVLNALYFYWFKTDDLIDYFLFDYIIATAYNNIPEVKDMIDLCEYSNPGAYRLVKEMNSLYTKDLYDYIFKDTYMFKLTHKLDFKKENLVGKKTIYGYLVEGC